MDVERWRRIVSRATPMRDRLREGWQPDPDSERVAKRLAAWQLFAAGGDAERFSRRLAWDGFEGAALTTMLSAGGWSAEVPMPDWVAPVTQVLDDLGPPVTPPSAERERLPYDDLLGAVTAAARRSLGDVGLAPTVLDGFERALLRRLHWFCLDALHVSFCVQRDRSTSSFGRLVEGVQPSGTTAIYDRFVRQTLEAGLEPLLECYPVLARLLGTAIGAWRNWVVEFARRLAEDGPRLAELFGVSDAVGVSGSVSDRHDGGRSTVVVAFGGGRRLVYKPRDAAVDAAWMAVQAWVEARGLSLPLRPVRMLSRGAYAWFEHVEARPADGPRAVARFYRRCGSLAALLYLLEGNDAHLENLIAHDDHPVLVDVETLLHPLVMSPAMTAEAQQARVDSVVRTGLLPRAMTAGDAVMADFSALGAAAVQRGLVPRPHWRHVNTDAMEVYADHGVNLADAHRPGADARPADHLDALIDGFEELYTLVRRHRSDFIEGPLALLGSARVRWLPRNTLAHFLTLREAARAPYLRDGVDHSIRLDWIARAYLIGSERPPHWPLLALETAALERMDIPRITAEAGGHDLIADGVRVRDCARSGLEQVRHRLGAMDGANLARQLDILREAFSSGDGGTSRGTGASDTQLPEP